MTADTIVRSPRRERWTTLNNRLIEDERLGPMALAILVYLLSKPDDWTVMMADLSRRFGCKEYKIRTGIGQLVAAGYMKLEPVRAKDGTLGGRRYVVTEDPSDAGKNPTSDKLRSSEPGERRKTPNIGEITPIVSTEYGIPISPDCDLKGIAASTDDAADAADPAPPETLVKAGTTNPNGTATQAEPNGIGKPKPRKSSAPAAPLGPGSLVYRDAVHLTPNHAQREILDAAHAAHGEAAMRAVMVAWMAHGYSPKNVAGMVEAINAGGLRTNGHNGAGSRANGKPLSAMVLEI